MEQSTNWSMHNLDGISVTGASTAGVLAFVSLSDINTIVGICAGIAAGIAAVSTFMYNRKRSNLLDKQKREKDL